MTTTAHPPQGLRPLDPTARDFDALLAQLRQRVQQRFAPQQVDLSDAGLLGMLLDLFAAVGDGLHFQLDSALHELFWDTVRDRDAAARLAALVGYRPQGATAAVVSLRFSRPPPQGDSHEPLDHHSTVAQGSNSRVLGPAVTIPARTPVATADGDIVFETLQEARLLPQQQHVEVPAEHAHWQEEVLDNTGQPEQVLVGQHLPCVAGDIQLYVQDTPWQQVEDFLASGPTDAHYRVRVDAHGQLQVHLGDGLHGRLPTGPLRVRYRTGGGPQGNVPAGCLCQLEQALYDTTGQMAPLSVTNLHPASGGAPPEPVAHIRRNALLHLRSQQRAVTEQDIQQQAQAVPGVGRVKLLTQRHDVAIAPHSGFLYIAAAQAPSTQPPSATQQPTAPLAPAPKRSKPSQHTDTPTAAVQPAADAALIRRVQQHFAQRVPLPIGFVLHVLPAAFVPIDLAWQLWPQPGVSRNSLQQALQHRLQQWLAPNSQQPWGRLPHASAFLHQAHQAHPSIQGATLLTDLSAIQLQPHQLPVLGQCTLTFATVPVMKI